MINAYNEMHVAMYYKHNLILAKLAYSPKFLSENYSYSYNEIHM